MASASSWLFIWVPSRQHERDQKSESVDRTEDSISEVDGREQASSPEERFIVSPTEPELPVSLNEDNPSVQSEPLLNESISDPPVRPNKFIVTPGSTERPVLKSLPAIQEDIDPSINQLTSSGSADMVASLSTPDTDKLPKQESYDSHVKRGLTTPVTPSTDQMTPGHGLNTQDNPFVPFLDFDPMEDIVAEILDSKDVNFSSQGNKKHTRVLFTFCLPSEKVEETIIQLQKQGVGHTKDSSISVIPASIHCHYENDEKAHKLQENEAKMDKFYNSIKSRLHVAEVMARITAGAQFSFDYLLLLILASMISFMGLLENSSVVLVASMLVSPLMGPILAGIFGAVVADKHLTSKGIRHETESLLICIGLGFLLGLPACQWIRQYDVPQWPTPEMMSRGELRSLWVGVLIAVPSGAGVALSVLGGNAGSLVGVAISASLLPPAVNAGIFWAMSAILAISGPSSLTKSKASESSFHGFGEEFNDETNITVSLYQYQYSDSPAIEALVLGAISLSVTLLNILCIILTGIFILRIKEVTHDKIPQKFATFWKRDIKTARHYGKAFKKGKSFEKDKHDILTEMRLELAKNENFKEDDVGLQGTFLQSMFDRVAMDDDLINIRQWVAMPPTVIVPSGSHSSKSPSRYNSNYSQGDYSLLSPDSGSTCYGDISPQATWHSRRSRLSRLQSNTDQHGNFLDLPNFFTSEIDKSKNFRKRLKDTAPVLSAKTYPKAKTPMPTNV